MSEFDDFDSDDDSPKEKPKGKYSVCKIIYGGGDEAAHELEAKLNEEMSNLLFLLYLQQEHNNIYMRLSETFESHVGQVDEKKECGCALCANFKCIEFIDSSFDFVMEKLDFETENERKTYIKGYYDCLDEFTDELDLKHKNIFLINEEEFIFQFRILKSVISLENGSKTHSQ